MSFCPNCGAAAAPKLLPNGWTAIECSSCRLISFVDGRPLDASPAWRQMVFDQWQEAERRGDDRAATYWMRRFLWERPKRVSGPPLRKAGRSDDYPAADGTRSGHRRQKSPAPRRSRAQKGGGKRA